MTIRARRIVALFGLGVAISAVAGITAAFVFEHVAAWRDDRIAPQVGRSIDIGGRTLNIHCLGNGSPTVIFVSGRVSPGYVWTPTQRGVSAFTHACWYDRAALGWSDPGPDPSWGDSAARDLHALLSNAGSRPPYVMVGHSFGGYIIRLYHHAYPGVVAGMVFADTAHEDAGSIPNMPYQAPPPIPRAVLRAMSIGLSHLGMMRWISRHAESAPVGWTASEWDTLERVKRRRGTLLADAQVGPERATSDLVRATGGLEDMPMIVLTQGRGPRGWIELQKTLADRSRRGRQLVLTGIGHGIPERAPTAVINAVRDIVDEVRGKGTLPIERLRD